MQEWKEFEYKGLRYKASNDGVIIGLARNKVIKQRINEDGYAEVTLGDTKHRNGKVKVHRIVASLFVDNPREYEEVNHLDFNRTNNVYTNLQWCSHKDNIDYSVKAGNYKTVLKQGENNGRALLTVDDVVEIKQMLKDGVSNIKIGEKFGVAPSTIWNIKAGNTWKNV